MKGVCSNRVTGEPTRLPAPVRFFDLNFTKLKQRRCVQPPTSRPQFENSHKNQKIYFDHRFFFSFFFFLSRFFPDERSIEPAGAACLRTGLKQKSSAHFVRRGPHKACSNNRWELLQCSEPAGTGSEQHFSAIFEPLAAAAQKLLFGFFFTTIRSESDSKKKKKRRSKSRTSRKCPDGDQNHVGPFLLSLRAPPDPPGGRHSLTNSPSCSRDAGPGQSPEIF